MLIDLVCNSSSARAEVKLRTRTHYVFPVVHVLLIIHVNSHVLGST